MVAARPSRCRCCVLHAHGVGRLWLGLLGVLGVDAGDRCGGGAGQPLRHAAASARRCCRRWSCASGVPAHLRTLVAVPTLLTTAAAIDEQIERLEVHYLASPEGELYFALLSDWTDADDRDTSTAMQRCSQPATDGIARLNRRYGPAPGGDRFLLLHRRRVWNEGEARWMGWERKRGKLHELNRLLRGATDTSFLPSTASRRACPPTSATSSRSTPTRGCRATRSAAWSARWRIRSTGRASTPLAGRVVEGYGILQPRVTPSLPVGREGSLFQRIFSSMNGIDPYAAAVSDVYQDLFGEGSYTGKGIYDVDAFEAALAGRVPDTTLLSHDLFEGMFARAGLASDIEVVEEFPARYDVAAPRQHRWARGDWQLAAVDLRARPVGEDQSAARCRRSAAGRCSTICGARCRRRRACSSLLAGLDLAARRRAASGPASSSRRSCCRPSSRSSLPSCRAVPGSRCAAISARLAAICVLALAQSGARGHLPGASGLADGRCDRADAVRGCSSPAGICSNGSRRRRRRSVRGSILLGFYRRMAGGVVVGCSGLVVVGCCPGRGHGRWRCRSRRCGSRRRRSRAGSAGRPRSPADCRYRPPTREALRLIARRTWRFFETFVTPADNMLPPDNFQEDPMPVVAHRTSPTNLGLYLLSAVSRPRLRLARHDRSGRAARGDAGDDGQPRALPRPFLQLVRHARICGRSIRPTSPRSTAATWPAT